MLASKCCRRQKIGMPAKGLQKGLSISQPTRTHTCLFDKDTAFDSSCCSHSCALVAEASSLSAIVTCKLFAMVALGEGFKQGKEKARAARRRNTLKCSSYAVMLSKFVKAGRST